mgnify:CR=1 FL=1
MAFPPFGGKGEKGLGKRGGNSMEKGGIKEGKGGEFPTKRGEFHRKRGIPQKGGIPVKRGEFLNFIFKRGEILPKGGNS